ncbi:MAG: hypothetical protein ABEJ04_02530 [Halobacteriaceae archaeon]
MRRSTTALLLALVVASVGVGAVVVRDHFAREPLPDPPAEATRDAARRYATGYEEAHLRNRVRGAADASVGEATATVTPVGDGYLVRVGCPYGYSKGGAERDYRSESAYYVADGVGVRVEPERRDGESADAERRLDLRAYDFAGTGDLRVRVNRVGASGAQTTVFDRTFEFDGTGGALVSGAVGGAGVYELVVRADGETVRQRVELTSALDAHVVVAPGGDVDVVTTDGRENG